MNKARFFFIAIVLFIMNTSFGNQTLTVSFSGYHLSWDLDKDIAAAIKSGTKDTLWKGSLMPALWILADNNEKQYLKAKYNILSKNDADSSGEISISFGSAAKGTILFTYNNNIFQFTRFSLEWAGKPQPIIALYFGTSFLTDQHRQVVPTLEYPFWPDWQAEGYCVPSAKGSPLQSFFRNWQFGNATIPLGSFGEAMGTPYAAAFPRPLFSMSMGGKAGWIVMGSGTIPDAAMSLRIKSATGCLEYLYREDLWGAMPDKKRGWEKPLMVTIAPSAWDAYHMLFSAVSKPVYVDPVHQLNHWNTWGDFMNKEFNMPEIIKRAKEFEAEETTLDMSWETFECSGIPNKKRFPEFENDIQKIKESGMKLGFWQSVLWVKDYQSLGLTEKDLIVGRDAKPRLVNWVMSPYSDQMYYALDPSSENTKKFLKERTQRIIRDYHADLLKLDFAYDLPSPDVGVPRNPALRGEMYAYTLLKIIVDAAREIKPDISIQYYSISPLFNDVQNLLALDDMGDAGNDEKGGHGQWSVWSALAGMQGMAIMASSGYNWDNDVEILLNTAIIGSPGLVLPRTYNGGAITDAMKNKRLALARWYRRTTGWEPLWLNSIKGGLTQEPTPYCWGRLETINGTKQLTSLVLRENKKEKLNGSEINNLTFSGNWALISQDNSSVFETKKLACIPFGEGEIKIPLKNKPVKVSAIYADKTVDLKTWKWEQNKLVFKVSKELADNMLGMIVENQ